MKKIFISFPYSHSDPKIIAERVAIARRYCLKLLKEGHFPISPALFGHDLIKSCGLDQEEQDMTFNAWDKFCYSYMDGCKEMHVLKLDGHDISLGVMGEKLKARLKRIKILEIRLEDITL